MNNYPWLDHYLLAKAGAEKDYKTEWEWWRYRLKEKMYAATCQPGPTHVAYANRELLTLKCDPIHAAALQEQYPDIVPGFYMDKRHWISIFLDGSVPDDLLRSLCDQAYTLVLRSLPKKTQREITGEA